MNQIAASTAPWGSSIAVSNGDAASPCRCDLGYTASMRSPPTIRSGTSGSSMSICTRIQTRQSVFMRTGAPPNSTSDGAPYSSTLGRKGYSSSPRGLFRAAIRAIADSTDPSASAEASLICSKM